MSAVTDLVFVIPRSAWLDYPGRADVELAQRAAAVRFADLFTAFPVAPLFRPEPVEDNGTKYCGATVFHLGVNHLAPGFIDALRAEPWPRGTVLYLQHENDDEPTVTVWTRNGLETHGETDG